MAADSSSTKTPSSEEAKVHIVYTEQPPVGTEAESHHLGTLASVLGSEEAAKEALVYTYSHAATGFSAKLTQDQVDQLSKKPGVLQVLPSQTLQLHSGPGRMHQYVPRGQFFDYAFLTTFVSQYVCLLEDTQYKEQILYDAYDINNNQLIDDICGGFHMCEWIIKEGGLYAHNADTGKYIFHHKWINSHHLTEFEPPSASPIASKN
ncbi:hypothetical protein ACFE04_004577 [Oxalis oulophora]